MTADPPTPRDNTARRSTWQELGWVDGAEFRRYFDVIPLEPDDAYERFLRWKTTDGSKAGLFRTFPETDFAARLKAAADRATPKEQP